MRMEVATKQNWKSRLYERYVSSGQAGASGRNTHDLLAPRRPTIHSIIRKHLPADRDARILDLGCGYGAFIFHLNEAGYRNCVGFDASAEQVELARELGLKNVECNDLTTVLKNCADSSVDIVLVMDILEHMARQELFDVLDDIHRVLRPQGKCIAHVPNAEGMFGMRIRYGDWTHESAFTPRSAKQCFTTVGFRQVDCFEDRPIIHGAVSGCRRVIWDLGTLFPRLLLMAETGQRRFVLSQNMLIVAVK